MEPKKDHNTEDSAGTNTDASSSKAATTVARVQRNVAEKLRRDKLNGYISELATIVPIVSRAAKRMDKTSILRLSAAYLRICKSPLSGRKKLKSFKWCPNFLNPDQVRDILESVDGFLLVAEASGKILFTSRSVERYLGHQDIDMVGHTLHMFIHPEDVEMVKGEINRLGFTYTRKDSTKSIPRCSFYCRMKEKSQPRSEVQTYQFVHIMGAMTFVEEEDSENITKKASPTFKAFIKIVDANPYNQLSLEEAIADEYVTRHSIDGTIIFADHRISTITGYMPHEVTGFNAYKYIHMEDARVALFAQHLMFSSDKGTGMIVYRLRTSDEKYVYLKTVGSLHRDSSTSQVDYFICINQQLSESDGQAQLKYFTDCYQPHIKGSTASSLHESVKALQASNCEKTNSLKVDKAHNVNAETILAHKNVKHKKSENTLPQHQESSQHNMIRTKMKNNDSEQLEIQTEVTSFEGTLLGSSGGPTFVLKTPLVSTKCNENQLENMPRIERNHSIENVAKTLDIRTSEADNNSTYNFIGNIYTSVSSNGHSILPHSSTKHSSFSEIKMSIDSPPIYNETSNVIPSVNGPSVVSLATVDQNASTPLKVIQLKNLDLLHIISKGDINVDIVTNGINSDIYHCSDNLQIVEDFQKSATNMRVDNSNFFVKVENQLKSPEPNINVPPLLNDKDSDNTQSSTLDSEDSETITLMSPMCPLKKELSFNRSTTGVGSPSSSIDFCDTSYKQNDEEFKEALPFHDDFSTLLSSTLPHEDSSSSIPSSSNEWSDFYQPPEFLASLNSEDLPLKEEELSENMKAQLW